MSFSSSLVLYPASSPPLAFAAKILARSLGCPARAVASAPGRAEMEMSPASFCFCFWQGMSLLPPGQLVLLHYLSAPRNPAALLARSPGAQIRAVIGDGAEWDSVGFSAPKFRLPFFFPSFPSPSPSERKGACFAYGPAACLAGTEKGFVCRSASFLGEKEARRAADTSGKVLFLGGTPLGRTPAGEDLLLAAPFLAAGAWVVWARPEEISRAQDFPARLSGDFDFGSEVEKILLSLSESSPPYQGPELSFREEKDSASPSRGAEEAPAALRPPLDLALYGPTHTWRLARHTWPRGVTRVYGVGYYQEDLEEVGRVLEREIPPVSFHWAVILDPVPPEKLGEGQKEYEIVRFKSALGELLRQFPGSPEGAEFRSFGQICPGVELISRSHLRLEQGEVSPVWEMGVADRENLWQMLSLPVAEWGTGRAKMLAGRKDAAGPREIVCVCSRLRGAGGWLTPEGEVALACRAGDSARQRYPRAEIFLLDFSRPDLGDLEKLARVFRAILIGPPLGEFGGREFNVHLAAFLRGLGAFSRLVKLDWRDVVPPDEVLRGGEERSIFSRPARAGEGPRLDFFSLLWEDTPSFLDLLEEKAFR